MTVPEEKTFEHVVVMNGNVEFLGKASSMVVVNGRVNLGPKAEITDRLVLINGKIVQQEGAKVPNIVGSESAEPWLKEKWTHFKNRFANGFTNSGTFSIFKILALPLVGVFLLAVAALMLIVGIVLFYVAPSFSHRADDALQASPFASLIWGLVGYISIVPILIVLLISIVGILVIPFYLIFVMLIGFAGLFAGLRGLGIYVLRKFGQENVVLGTFVGILIGFAVLMAPFFGQLAFSLIWIAGTGALLKSFTMTTRYFRVST